MLEEIRDLYIQFIYQIVRHREGYDEIFEWVYEEIQTKHVMINMIIPLTYSSKPDYIRQQSIHILYRLIATTKRHKNRGVPIANCSTQLWKQTNLNVLINLTSWPSCTQRKSKGEVRNRLRIIRNIVGFKGDIDFIKSIMCGETGDALLLFVFKYYYDDLFIECNQIICNLFAHEESIIYEKILTFNGGIILKLLHNSLANFDENEEEHIKYIKKGLKTLKWIVASPIKLKQILVTNKIDGLFNDSLICLMRNKFGFKCEYVDKQYMKQVGLGDYIPMMTYLLVFGNAMNDKRTLIN